MTKHKKTDYAALMRELKENGPGRLYMLWGEEDYLLKSFFSEIKKICIGDSAAEFNHHILDGTALDMKKLAESIDSSPFFTERTFIEVRGFNINACTDSQAELLKDIVSDMPEYATLVFLLPAALTPDGRLSAVKTLKKFGRAVEFTAQPQEFLITWIQRRFEALDKKISRHDCERLIFISGDIMTRLIPEIEKIASSIPGDTVSAQDIEEIAHRIPEADVFEMTNRLSARDFDSAARSLAELLHSGEHPIKILAMTGFQMRRLYIAKLAQDEGLGRDFLVETCGISSYAADKVLSAAKGFPSQALKEAVKLCALSDYRMKSTSEDDKDILKELFLKIAVASLQ